MAIPTYNEQPVPGVSRGPRMTGASAQAAGAQIRTANQGFQNLIGAATNTAQAYAAYENTKLENKLLESVNNYREGMNYSTEEYLKLQGGNATGSYDKFSAESNDMRMNIASQITDDRTRQRFYQAADDIAEKLGQNIRKNEYSETEKYNATQWQAQIDTMTEEAFGAYGSPAFEQVLGQINEIFETRGAKYGLPPEVIDKEKTDRTNMVYSNIAMNALKVDNTALANSILQNHGDMLYEKDKSAITAGVISANKRAAAQAKINLAENFNELSLRMEDAMAMAWDTDDWSQVLDLQKEVQAMADAGYKPAQKFNPKIELMQRGGQMFADAKEQGPINGAMIFAAADAGLRAMQQAGDAGGYAAAKQVYGAAAKRFYDWSSGVQADPVGSAFRDAGMADRVNAASWDNLTPVDLAVRQDVVFGAYGDQVKRLLLTWSP